MPRRVERVQARIFDFGASPELERAFGRFRKSLFVDRLGWSLTVDGDIERDEFDTHDATYCLLCADGTVVGGFRSIPCNRPYLARVAFPQLATTREYPDRSDFWEVSRFGMQPSRGQLGTTLYSVMLRFAISRQARSLVAVADPQHERLLRTIGIRTRRYGPPQTIGVDRQGRELKAVAGEIPINSQAQSIDHLLDWAEPLEINDEALVQRPRRIPA